MQAQVEVDKLGVGGTDRTVEFGANLTVPSRFILPRSPEI